MTCLCKVAEVPTPTLAKVCRHPFVKNNDVKLWWIEVCGGGVNNGGLRILEGEQISNEDQLLFLFERVNYRKNVPLNDSFEKGVVPSNILGTAIRM